MTDNSYKLFAAEPTPGHDPKKLVLPPNKSMSALSEVPQRDMFPDEEKDKAKHEHSKTQDAPKETTTEKKEVVRGPWRILRLLPRESRHVIARMLEIDPKKRATMAEILEDSWVSNAVICRQLESGTVIKADDHKHVLEPPTSTANPK